MAMSNEVELLKNISTEVDESKLRIFFSIQCNKAQASLLHRLKQKIKEGKDILNYITDGNKRIEIEIKLAEQEYNNLIIAHNTIKSGNIEIRKEVLLKIEENVELSKRIEAGEKKYEQLWLSSKSRFEKIPLVQRFLEGKKRIQLIENNISNLCNKCVTLSNEIKMKQRAANDLTQKHVIDLAKFIVNDRPNIIKMIQDRINEIQDLITKIENFNLPAVDSRYSKVKIIELADNLHPTKPIPEEKKFVQNDNDAIVMPKLQLMDVDLDILGVNLDQIKDIEPNMSPTVDQKAKSLQYKMDVVPTSTTFKNKWESYCEQNKSYSDRKLIHIIGDVTLGRSQTLNIISNVNPHNLQNVSTIGSQQTGERLKICQLPDETVSQNFKEIEEKTDTDNQNVQSPAQMLDRKKKKVSFDLSMENVHSEFTEIQNNMDVNAEDDKNNETANSHDVSVESEEGDEKLKDKILTAQKLDATPEFVYEKHFITNKITEDKIITSKFFDANKESEPRVISSPTVVHDTKIQEIQDNNFIKPLHMEMYKNKAFEETSSKITQDIQKPKFPISGLLFEHGGSQVIPDSLNVSLNATGLDDDSYPQCLDSSILLSPKADVTDAEENVTVMPQVPDFMSGLRKTGTSFFERFTNDNKPNSSTANTEGNFNFNFGTEEKKKGGGFFNMFFSN